MSLGDTSQPSDQQARTEEHCGCGLALQERRPEVPSEAAHGVDAVDKAVEPAFWVPLMNPTLRKSG